MRRCPPPKGLLLLFSLAVAAVLRPCRCWLAVGRWSETSAPFAARLRVPRRSSLSDDERTPAESYLSSVGFSDAESSKIKVRYKRRFDPDVENKIKPFLHWFSELGLTESQVHKVVVESSTVFRQRLEENA
mmetsp:Transcript_168461/g.541367  ORF Transcript_168461/g.541367 Transcript_168461/m.541367 type:complete len:131 (-) Transcript_168461:42-434(-)